MEYIFYKNSDNEGYYLLLKEYIPLGRRRVLLRII